ncbi:TPA: conjugal transfer protein TraD [Legionella pneumophila]|uniref:Conjugal transfer protein TraD n=1 Tax=Legionella norrlandica TaxID=1498499 RepID=A0A0A2SWH1_9GAMM|nr:MULTISPECIES: conjugal transfer protein TraD [Legionella]KGP64086.1 conjugal transfer protein TraD [Legionella norrlandica]MCW8435246.1 conjugal transfer protein TraD [Legionella pneumophila]MCZ4757825.1 conjugal transfer protein TraD [Legionella pneumophila]WAI64664.1 conjugal transfer protein TraD [Legionella pneumophila]WAI67651.1 conjugal transfer protein TraD [Legionella pneumophila]
MITFKQIEKEKQLIARSEKSLALEKLKNRRADTRLKIEFGGLVIKSRMNQFNKSTILGALVYIFDLMKQDASLEKRLEVKGQHLFKQ